MSQFSVASTLAGLWPDGLSVEAIVYVWCSSSTNMSLVESCMRILLTSYSLLQTIATIWGIFGLIISMQASFLRGSDSSCSSRLHPFLWWWCIIGRHISGYSMRSIGPISQRHWRQSYSELLTADRSKRTKLITICWSWKRKAAVYVLLIR